MIINKCVFVTNIYQNKAAFFFFFYNFASAGFK